MVLVRHSLYFAIPPLFVDDPQRSKSFYENVFDLSPIYEDEDAAAFGFENLIVNLLKVPAARDLGR